MTLDDADDRADLEAAARRGARDGVREALEPFAWAGIGAVVVLFGMTLASAVDDALGGVLVVPALVAVLFGFYLITYAAYEFARRGTDIAL